MTETTGERKAGELQQDFALRDIAIHEAGHAVALVRVNHDWGAVSVQATDDFLAKADGDGPDNIWVPEKAGTLAIVYASGYAAMIAHGIAEHVASETAWQDFDNAAEILQLWLPDIALVQCKAQALELMRKPENVRAVGFLADELLLRGTVDEERLPVLIDLAEGECTDEEYRQFLRF